MVSVLLLKYLWSALQPLLLDAYPVYRIPFWGTIQKASQSQWHEKFLSGYVQFDEGFDA